MAELGPLVGTEWLASNDAAYGLAAQLLAAKLNVAAQAGTCAAALQAILDGQALLANDPTDLTQPGVNFTATGSYLEPRATNKTLRAQATALAATLDSYNNNTLCP